jgi:hypothetical protein
MFIDFSSSLFVSECLYIDVSKSLNLCLSLFVDFTRGLNHYVFFYVCQYLKGVRCVSMFVYVHFLNAFQNCSICSCLCIHFSSSIRVPCTRRKMAINNLFNATTFVSCN